MSKLHKHNKQHDGGDEEEVAATIREELIKNKQNKSCQDNGRSTEGYSIWKPNTIHTN